MNITFYLGIKGRISTKYRTSFLILKALMIFQ